MRSILRDSRTGAGNHDNSAPVSTKTDCKVRRSLGCPGFSISRSTRKVPMSSAIIPPVVPPSSTTGTRVVSISRAAMLGTALAVCAAPKAARQGGGPAWTRGPGQRGARVPVAAPQLERAPLLPRGAAGHDVALSRVVPLLPDTLGQRSLGRGGVAPLPGAGRVLLRRLLERDAGPELPDASRAGGSEPERRGLAARDGGGRRPARRGP